jgi:hypothetical protein
MTQTDTLTSRAQPTTCVDGLEVEVFTTEEEAASVFAAVPSSVEQQAAAFVAHTATMASAW